TPGTSRSWTITEAIIAERVTTHPGDILREEFMAPLGLTANALARALRIDAPRIGEIVRERRGVTPDTALRLSRYFGTTAELWMNLQSAHDLSKAKAERAETIAREVVPRGAAA